MVKNVGSEELKDGEEIRQVVEIVGHGNIVTPEGLEAAAERYMQEVKDICDAKGQEPSLEELITTGRKAEGSKQASAAWLYGRSGHSPMELVVNRSFEAAHRLPGHRGKCARVHGHSYRVRVVVRGLVDLDSGMTIDFQEIKDVIDQLDHQYLNDILGNPTAERTAQWLLKTIPLAIEVRLWEGLGGCSVVARV